MALRPLCTGITWMADSDHVCESPPKGAWLRGGVSVEPTWVFLVWWTHTGLSWAQHSVLRNSPNPLKSLYIVCPLTKFYRCLRLDSLITTYRSNFSLCIQGNWSPETWRNWLETTQLLVYSPSCMIFSKNQTVFLCMLVTCELTAVCLRTPAQEQRGQLVEIACQKLLQRC